MRVKLCLELLWGDEFFFLLLNFVLHHREMKFTLKNICTLGFLFPGAPEGNVSRRNVDKQRFCVFSAVGRCFLSYAY